MTMDDALVIGRVREGTKDAFAVVIERYQAPVLRYLYRLTGNYHLAQDLTQDTFVQAYEGILKSRDDLQFKAWLYRIATNNAYKHFRRKKLISFVSFDFSPDALSLAEDDRNSGNADRLAILEALKSVPLNERCCLVLHLIDGFKYREIAETLGINEDAVRMRVTRGKQAFRKHYDREAQI